MWRKIRIALLLLVLFMVAVDAYLTHYRATRWDETLWVAIYPINPNHDPDVAAYIHHLSSRTFKPIEAFFDAEAQRVQLREAKPFNLILAHPVAAIPPTPPRDRSVLKVAWWSLKLRWWVFRHDHTKYSPQIRIFVLYQNYHKVKRLAHSLGLEKGMIGVVHAYAHRELQGKNNLVIAHEMLHTVGATDKYNLLTNQPLYPDGYAEPNKKPLYPQRYADLMAGRIPIDRIHSMMPRSLRSVIIGPKTLTEINWIHVSKNTGLSAVKSAQEANL